MILDNDQEHASAGRPARSADFRSLLRPYWPAISISILVSLFGTVVGLVQPLVAKEVIDAAGGQQALTVLLTLLVALFVVQAGAVGVSKWISGIVAEKITRDLRRSVVNRLIRLDLKELDRQNAGDLLSRATTDSIPVRDALSRSLVDTISGLLMAVGAIAVMAWMDPVLLAVVLAIAVTAAVVVGTALTGIRRASEQYQTGLGTISTDLERVLGGIRTVRVSQAEVREEARVGTAIDATYQAGKQSARLLAAVNPIIELVANSAFLAMLLIGSIRVATGAMTLSDLTAMMMYVLYLVMPVGMVMDGLASIKLAQGSYGRIRGALEFSAEKDELGLAATELAPVHDSNDPAIPALEFDNVHFSYTEAQTVLNGVSFTVSPRGSLALVGASGSGKSTIFSLICRFYDPTEGDIRFHGQSIETLTRQQCRSRIAIVEQDAPMLRGSVRENLTYINPDATDADIWEALAAVNLTGTIDALPDRLGTDVGARGIRLSGGERQRLAIARAILADPQIVLMDEPTASLDAKNESILSDTIDSIARSRSVVIIAHRPSTIENADQVIVLQEGTIAARGTYHDLVSQGLDMGSQTRSSEVPTKCLHHRIADAHP